MIKHLLNTSKDLINLFYPEVCYCCETHLTYNEKYVCVHCQHDFAFADFTKHKNNPVEKSFHGRIPIQTATSLFLFHKKGKIQKLIHQLKYNNQQNIGKFLGTLLSEDILNSKRFSAIDYIIPVPLHKKRHNERGYNQLTEIGKTLAIHLKTVYLESALIKKEISGTQTKKLRFDRWKNATESFELVNTEQLENCHILLIDDVITTGATLEACCNQLLNTKNITISIATIAYTE